MHTHLTRRIVLPAGLLVLAATAATAPKLPFPNHGPGTSGGGSSTLSGETLKEGQFALSLRSDWTRYESIDREEAEDKALEQGEFDALERTWVQTLALEYGVTDDLQLGIDTGWYRGTGFLDAEEDGMGGAESADADPEGLLDLWLRGKWRVARGPSGHLSVLGGVKLPTGTDDEELSNGERLEPSSQPGSGALDYQLGLAYSRYLTPQVTFDASAAYTARGEEDDFRVGDRLDAGLALAYRVTEDVRAPDNWSVFGELQAIWLGKDEEEGEENDNSGGTTVYLSAGVRQRLNEHVSWSLAPAVPVLQDVNGEQVESDWRAALTLSFTW